MKVIDISAWQENIDWEAVKANGIEGVILKLGERNNLDAMFIKHVNDAVAHGIKYGVYYYAHASNIVEAKKEAAWVDEQIKTYLNGRNPELGIWYDAEDKDMQSGNVTASCSAFVCALNEIGYTYVGIYSSYNWLANGIIDVNQLADYVPYWVAQYYHENSFKQEFPNKLVRMWQYTDCYSAELPYDGNIYYEGDK